MQKTNLEKLNQEFKRIREMGYVKSTRNGYTSVGKTLEDLLGKKEETLTTPDYYGIELKTKIGYSNSYTTLFNLTPDGNLVIERLSQTYGYPDKILKNKKVLNISITSTPTLVANRYFFNLKVDYFQRKLKLIIQNKFGDILEEHITWSFDNLKERLEQKLKYLALVNAWSTTRNNEKYYKYYQIKYYKLRDFDKFIELIDKGIIRVSIKMGVFRTGIKKGLSHDRGTSFELKPLDFYMLFERIYV